MIFGIFYANTKPIWISDFWKVRILAILQQHYCVMDTTVITESQSLCHNSVSTLATVKQSSLYFLTNGNSFVKMNFNYLFFINSKIVILKKILFTHIPSCHRRATIYI